MIKKLLFVGIVLSSFIVLADSNIILKIGNNTITEDNIKLKKILIDNLFKRKYHRLPGPDDKKRVNAIELKWQKYKLYKVVKRLIMKKIKSKYYNKILTPDVISQYVKKNKEYAKDRIRRKMIFLAAADYIKKSKEEKKYEIAYEKYKKLGMGFSYKFFRSNVDNKNFLIFLRRQVNELSKEGITEGEKKSLFKKNLPAYIMSELSAKDEKIKQHLQLAKGHSCNYKELLYEKWLVEQGNKMGIKIYDSRYGSSLKEILNIYKFMQDLKI